jgi:hypothetical protein
MPLARRVEGDPVAQRDVTGCLCVNCRGRIGEWGNIMLCRALREGADPISTRTPRALWLMILRVIMLSETLIQVTEAANLSCSRVGEVERDAKGGISTVWRNSPTPQGTRTLDRKQNAPI